jgi:aminoglycoside phosphotransferase (APT) family kinase protein
MSVDAREKEGVFVAPAMREFGKLAGLLKVWLKSRLPSATDLRLSNFEYPRGTGQSHETILFDLDWREDGADHHRGLVVRIKPTTFTVYRDDMFIEQYRVMKAMRDSGRVRIAELVWLEEDPSILGAPFFVMEKLTGRVAVSIPSYMEVGWITELSPAERERLWRNGVAQLAAIQTVPIADLAFLHRPADGDPIRQEWNRWRRYLEWLEARGPATYQRATFHRLEATFPKNPVEGIVWGDARLGNLMIGSDLDVVAVMDWEQPGLGGALDDLGWWIFNERLKIEARGSNLEGLGSREDVIALWTSLTGLPVDDIDWYEAFAGFRISCLYWNMLEMRGQAQPDLTVNPIGRSIDSLLAKVETKT